MKNVELVSREIAWIGTSLDDLKAFPDDDQRNTFRAVYTVKFSTAVYILHAFQKKSKRGVATPKREIEKIKQRLKAARREHTKRLKEARGNGEK